MKTVQQLGLLLWLMPWIAVHANTVIRFPLSTRVIEATPIIEDLKFGFKPTLPYFQLRELNAPLPPFWFSLKYVSKIKDQGERGTCTIFTTLDSIESTLKSQYNIHYELSAQFLYYLVSTQLKFSQDDESNVTDNVNALKKHGILHESEWDYNPKSWLNEHTSIDVLKQKAQTCDWIEDPKAKRSCYIAQWGPYKIPNARIAKSTGSTLALESLLVHQLRRSSEIKIRLSKGLPVILDVPIFYAAWNHPVMEELGLGTMDTEKFQQGVVQSPSHFDIEVSKTRYGSHSIVLVGYNDTDRVYYFKNSWGTDYWGSASNISEFGSVPGFGSIPYDYANEHGTFTSIDYED